VLARIDETLVRQGFWSTRCAETLDLQGFQPMSAMPDGTYDVFIVDAETIDEHTMRVEIAMVTGENKGDVFAINGPHLARDPIDLLGLPGVLVVENGVPRLRVER
jgi:hypothetical protein